MYKRDAILMLLAALLGQAGCAGGSPRDNPRAALPPGPPHTSHAAMINTSFDSPQAVTRECLRCHPAAAREMMATSHWTWESDSFTSPLTGQPIRLGKKNVLNNFCIGVQGNEVHCMACHAGYGWKDDSFDFSRAESVDCLICHDGSGTYRKDPEGAGLPAAGVDLLAAAKSVARPSRGNCGSCHFAGGGGDGVKHGDLDGTLVFPTERNDVHMGRYSLLCQDCHRTQQHNIRGRLPSVSNRSEQDVQCTDCHSPQPHASQRLNLHTAAVSCQACHIPRFAVEEPTKMNWDWSAAGQDIANPDPLKYSKKKGSFNFNVNQIPEYYWFNGQADIYLPGQKVQPGVVLALNRPQGGIGDTRSKIYPFKVHRGRQAYDSGNNWLLVPRTVGPGGYWTDFDWDEALRLGSQSSGIPYSGQFGFIDTEMYWPTAHMVAPKEQALQCTDCHGEDGRMDWRRLGYDGDPLRSGGRNSSSLRADAGGGAR
jgi:octaheme c-type cytochrome (tetrathionate reductase family)